MASTSTMTPSHPACRDSRAQHVARLLRRCLPRPNVPSVLSSVCWHPPRSNWRRLPCVGRRPDLPRYTEPPLSRTDDATDHSRGTARAGSWKRWNGPARGCSDRDVRTSDRRGSDAPLRRGGPPTGCQNSTRPGASRSAVPDRPTGTLCGCRSLQDACGCYSDRQTGQSISANDPGARDPRARTCRTTPLALPVSRPIVANPSLQSESNQRPTRRSTDDFSTKYAAKQG